MGRGKVLFSLQESWSLVTIHFVSILSHEVPYNNCHLSSSIPPELTILIFNQLERSVLRNRRHSFGDLSCGTETLKFPTWQPKALPKYYWKLLCYSISSNKAGCRCVNATISCRNKEKDVFFYCHGEYNVVKAILPS